MELTDMRLKQRIVRLLVEEIVADVDDATCIQGVLKELRI